jgi:hypothetical protein
MHRVADADFRRNHGNQTVDVPEKKVVLVEERV